MVDMARVFLTRKGVEHPRREAELLVAHALGLGRLELFLRLDQPVTAAEVDRARDALVRRGRREPVAYITGRREFYGRPFRVGPGVLVPRPETELLVDLARERFAKSSRPDQHDPYEVNPTGSAPEAPHAEREASEAMADPGAPAPLRVLDVGTGSGCLAVTLALELPRAHVTGVDLSEDALAYARANGLALGGTLEWIRGDGVALVRASGPYDLVVSNPPYVELEEGPELAPEVREHEPPLALYAPPGDPDHFARALLEAGERALVPGGILLVELGHRQGPRVLSLAQRLGFRAQLHADLEGVPRVLEARRD